MNEDPPQADKCHRLNKLLIFTTLTTNKLGFSFKHE